MWQHRLAWCVSMLPSVGQSWRTLLMTGPIVLTCYGLITLQMLPLSGTIVLLRVEFGGQLLSKFPVTAWYVMKSYIRRISARRQTWISARKRLYRFTRRPVTRPSMVRTVHKVFASTGAAKLSSFATAVSGTSRTWVRSDVLLPAFTCSENGPVPRPDPPKLFVLLAAAALKEPLVLTGDCGLPIDEMQQTELAVGDIFRETSLFNLRRFVSVAAFRDAMVQEFSLPEQSILASAPLQHISYCRRPFQYNQRSLKMEDLHTIQCS